MMSLLPLAVVPLMVWIAVWAYLWTLDRRVKRLERMIDSADKAEAGE